MLMKTLCSETFVRWRHSVVRTVRIQYIVTESQTGCHSAIFSEIKPSINTYFTEQLRHILIYRVDSNKKSINKYENNTLHAFTVNVILNGWPLSDVTK